jgi:hypothetical protein
MPATVLCAVMSCRWGKFDRLLTRAVLGSPEADLGPDSSAEIKGIR